MKMAGKVSCRSDRPWQKILLNVGRFEMTPFQRIIKPHFHPQDITTYNATVLKH